jgi:hypothetical protein
MKRLAFTAFFLCSVLSFIGSAQALSIDEFLGDGVASSSIAGTPASAIVVSSSAIGGNRALYSIKNSNGAGTARLETFADPEFVGDLDYSLGYTQGAHTGQGIVTWDGDNFLQDGGSAIQLGVKFFDYPASLPIDITLRLYDSNGIGGLKYSDVTITLNQAMNFSSPFNLSIPYSRFTTSGPSTVPAPAGLFFTTNTSFGPGGAIDMTKVGAIQLIINGLSNSNAPDLTLDYVKTDGRCSAVPNSAGMVVDDCGVCIGQPGYQTSKDSCGVCFGNNAAKDDCGVCFGNNAGKDSCGVCYGNNAAKDSCGICFGNNASKDSCGLCPSAPTYNNSKDPCGVCFGNGTSCADCSGTPNGLNKVDVCGVCAGNGTSCLDCSGTPFGTKGIDICNVCGGSGNTCLDCKGVPFGSNKLDACGICAGTTQDASQCTTTDLCVQVEATSEILAFEKRLVDQTKTVTKKYK